MEHLRSEVSERMRLRLFGPFGGEDEEIRGKPFWRYMSGILFPPAIQAEGLGESDEPDAVPFESDGAEVDDGGVGLSYKELPSSLGVSFYVDACSRIECSVEAGRYAQTGRADTWKRASLASAGEPEKVVFDLPAGTERGTLKKKVLGGRAYVSLVFRPKGTGSLLTATLVNCQKSPSDSVAKQVEAMLFQCRLSVVALDGKIGEYPTVAHLSKHPEDEELALGYRERKTYGIGHGCAAQWTVDVGSERVSKIVAEPLPHVVVKGLTNDISLSESARKALSIRWLASPDTPREGLRETLNAFVNEYEGWIERQRRAAKRLPTELHDVANRLVERQERAVVRMREGIKVLLDDGSRDIPAAFRIAQEAMLRQFLWARRQGLPKTKGEGLVAEVDPWQHTAEPPEWRPFQLAFQLLVIPSLVEVDHPERDTLDLLWFPTGGGKTEAYLALCALEAVLARLRYGDAGSGTRVIMRYTLRLLTSQQFERCSTLVSVLETMRKGQPKLGLGQRRFRLGLWVGGDTTPNRLDNDDEKHPGAMQLAERVRAAMRPENPFQLLACPHCSTRLVPVRRAGEEEYGIDVTASRFRLFCPDERCLLHQEIPVSVVDDDLYADPPTVLIGTIDKFARMVWEPKSRRFWGNEDRLPPGLILQDELHLITGPLGTIAGVYEAAIDTILKKKGVTPKYLAATATIQRAGDQCRALYDRTAFVFPPPGLDAADSFFTKTDDNDPGRMYLGVMGPGLYSALTSLIQVSSAAADSVLTIPKGTPDQEGREARDSYWTQVIYHNSRQELGKTTTMLRDDVRTRLEVLEPNASKRRKFENVEELSANLKGSDIALALERLKLEYPANGAIDALACTNMISVGVDVARLGLMIVKGQPKSTAEYIQASSRIGRSRKRLPGIVIALYTSFRPRDRSHYETFQAFHQSLYRGVEPATVTPFAEPALDRTLHAALVLAVRHLFGWDDSSDAAAFSARDQGEVVAALQARLERAASQDELRLIDSMLALRVREWEAAADEGPPSLNFAAGRQYRNLLRAFEQNDAKFGLWPTLNSMRHVDGETPFVISGI